MAAKTHLNQAIISHFLELKADAHPDKEILVFENSSIPHTPDEVLTYGRIYEDSNKIARAFLDAGLKKGDAYGVFMLNHSEFVLSMLAGPVIGTIMVPIDPRSRGERLKFLLTNSNAKAGTGISHGIFASMVPSDRLIDEIITPFAKIQTPPSSAAGVSRNQIMAPIP